MHRLRRVRKVDYGKHADILVFVDNVVIVGGDHDTVCRIDGDCRARLCKGAQTRGTSNSVAAIGRSTVELLDGNSLRVSATVS